MINNTIKISNEGIILEDNIKLNIDKEQLAVISSLIYGASNKLGKICKKSTDDIIIDYNDLKIKLTKDNDNIIVSILNN